MSVTATDTPHAAGAAVLKAAGIVCVAFILTNAPTPLYAHWRAMFGFDTATQASIFSCYILGLVLALLFVGQLSDHFGRRMVLVPSLLLAMGADGLFLWTPDVTTLMVARFLTGACIGGIVSAGMANVVDRAAPEAKRQASFMASIAMVLGAALGPFIGGIFAQFSSRPVMLTFGVEMVLLCLALWWTADIPARARARSPFRLSLPSLRGAHMKSVVWGIGFFGPGLTSTCFVVSLGPNMFAAAMQIDSPLLSGIAAFAMFMTAVVTQILVRKLGLKSIFLLSGFASLGAMAALWLSLHFAPVPLLIAAALLAGAGQGLGQLAGLTMIALTAPVARRAEANGLMNMGGYVPAGLFPIAAGLAIDHLGLERGVALLALAVGVLAIGAIVALVMRFTHESGA